MVEYGDRRRRSSYFYVRSFDLGGMRRSTSGPAHAVGRLSDRAIRISAVNCTLNAREGQGGLHINSIIDHVILVFLDWLGSGGWDAGGRVQ